MVCQENLNPSLTLTAHWCLGGFLDFFSGPVAPPGFSYYRGPGPPASTRSKPSHASSRGIRLRRPRQRLIASELDRTPAEIIKKLEEIAFSRRLFFGRFLVLVCFLHVWSRSRFGCRFPFTPRYFPKRKSTAVSRGLRPWLTKEPWLLFRLTNHLLSPPKFQGSLV